MSVADRKKADDHIIEHSPLNQALQIRGEESIFVFSSTVVYLEEQILRHRLFFTNAHKRSMYRFHYVICSGLVFFRQSKKAKRILDGVMHDSN